VHLVLSGEGNSDLGLFCSFNKEFIAGSMYFIVDKIIEKKYDFSYYDVKDEMITFIPKVELTKFTRRLPPFTGKKGLKGTAYFTNSAIALAKIAKEKSKELDDDRGVAMIPKPKSEAWLLCALKNKPYESCEKLEDRSGNDDSPNSLKKSWML